MEIYLWTDGCASLYEVGEHPCEALTSSEEESLKEEGGDDWDRRIRAAGYSETMRIGEELFCIEVFNQNRDKPRPEGWAPELRPPYFIEVWTFSKCVFTILLLDGKSLVECLGWLTPIVEQTSQSALRHDNEDDVRRLQSGLYQRWSPDSKSILLTYRDGDVREIGDTTWRLTEHGLISELREFMDGRDEGDFIPWSAITQIHWVEHDEKRGEQRQEERERHLARVAKAKA
jgi:hypothetical protein